MDINNLILQWGTTPSGTCGAGKSAYVDGTFPISFPNVLFCWIVSGMSAQQNHHAFETTSLSGYRYEFYNSSAKTTHTDRAKYIVIGY